MEQRKSRCGSGVERQSEDADAEACRRCCIWTTKLATRKLRFDHALILAAPNRPCSRELVGLSLPLLLRAVKEISNKSLRKSMIEDDPEPDFCLSFFVG